MTIMVAPSRGSLLAELIGTFMLVFTAGCVALCPQTSPTWAPTAVAFAYMVLLYCFGSASGGHFNPAVTVATGLVRKLNWAWCVTYVIVQIGAGIAASYACAAVYAEAIPTIVPNGPHNYWWQAFIVEALYTGMLALVWLCTSRPKGADEDYVPNQYYGLAVACVHIAGGYSVQGISGGVFNPAIAIGFNTSNHQLGFTYGWQYTCYQLVGSILAALCFRLVRPSEFANMSTAAARAGMAASVDHLQLEVVQDPISLLPARLTAEFIGTFIMVLTMCLCVLADPGSFAWAVGAAAISATYAFADISGGHFNPAVTFAVVLSKRSSFATPFLGFLYILTQAVAAAIVGTVYPHLQWHVFPLAPKNPYTDAAAYVVELIYTFLIAFMVLSTSCIVGITSANNRNYYFGLGIGICYTVAGFAAFNISGGLANPATVFGVSLADTMDNGSMYYCVTYVLAELFGGLAASLIFYVTHAREYSTKKTVSNDSLPILYQARTYAQH